MKLGISVLVAVLMFGLLQIFGATAVAAVRGEYRGRVLEAFSVAARNFLDNLGASLYTLGLDPERGAWTLAEAAKLTQNELMAGVAERFVLESVILDRLPLRSIDGNAFSYNEEATLPGVEFRAVNAAYAESTGTVVQRTETLSILGGDSDVDRFLVRTQGRTMAGRNDLRASSVRSKVKAAVIKYQDTFFNGSVAVDANSFDGLKIRLTGAQVLSSAANGMGPVAGGQDFFDLLDDLISRVRGGVDALYMNRALIRRISSSTRRLGLVASPSRDEFGRPITEYNGIPMLDPGTKADGTDILPFTETQGASTDASSIYAVNFSEDESQDGVGGLINGDEDNPFEVEDLGLLDAKPVYRTRIEGYVGLATYGKGAARLTGVRNL